MELGTDRNLVGPDEVNIDKNEVIILKDIALNIQRGKLYMIYGDIGSGKSMLLLSILNELNKKSHSSI